MTSQIRSLRLILGALLAFLFLAGVSPLVAAEAAKRTYDLPAGDAEQALRTFSQQSGKGVIAATDLVRGVTTNAVKGEFSAAEALDQMLIGTGLIGTEDRRSGTFAVRKETSVEAKNAPGRPVGDQAAAGSGDKKEEVVRLDTFEVFGAKSINADIPRTRNDVQPYVIFGREVIQNTPVANLEELLRTRLPMNQAYGAASQVSANSTSSINLRGLESNQTLILLDGRRLPSRTGGFGSLSQPDINGIPLGMIERIEILPSTASGIYGGGATGGVVNIITRKDYAGVELMLSYGSPFASDSSMRRADLNGSLSLKDGKTFVTFGISHTDGTDMLVQDNDLAARAVALQMANNPSVILTGFTPFLGSTPNIRASNGSNLVLKSGAALNSPITFVPVGYTGVVGDGGTALVANAGKFNMAMPNARPGALGGRIAAPTTDSAALSVRRSFGTRVEAYLDVSQYKNHGTFTLPLSSGSFSTTLAATAPNNPFTTAIRVAFPLVNLPDLPSFNESDSARLAGGVVVKLPAQWSAGLDYVWSRSRYLNQSLTNELGDPDGSGPGLAYATAVATGVLDVMRDLNATPLNFTPYLNPSPYFIQRYRVNSSETTFRVGGPALQLPGGPVTISASAQARRDKIPDGFNTSATANPTPSYTFSPESGVRAWAYYAEARVPVFGAQESGWKRDLELQLSVRRDESTVRARTSGDSIIVPSLSGPFPTITYNERDFSATKMTVGLKYAPTKDVAVRASWGTGFLAPGINQLQPSAAFPVSLNFIDPKRGNVPTLVPLTLTIGGNADLQPENSKSMSAGLVLTPHWLPRFRLSLDLTRIEKTGEIASLLPQDTVYAEAALPGRVTRAALTPADQALGYTAGAITAMDVSSVNVAQKRITAYDIQADYTLAPQSWGNLQLYAIGTYQPEYAFAVQPGAALLNVAGGQGAGGIWVKWKANGGFNWTRGPWTLGWNAQYLGSHLGYMRTSPAADAISILNLGNNGVIKTQVYHDVSLSYKTGPERTGWRWLIANSQFTVGVQNVFNTRPPAMPITAWNLSPVDSLGDARLARYSLSFRKHF